MMNRFDKKGGFFIVASIILSACAQIFMKLGMLLLHQHHIEMNMNLLQHAELYPVFAWVAAGLACYAVSMATWLAALARFELGLAYPLLSLSYVLVYIVAVYIPSLNESLTVSKSIGIFVIMTGVYFITQSRHDSRIKG